MTESLLRKAQMYVEKDAETNPSSIVPEFHQDHNRTTVMSRNIKLHDLYFRVSEGDRSAVAEMVKELKHREDMDSLFEAHFGDMIDAPEQPQDWHCYRKMVKGFEHSCGKFSDYSLQYVGLLAKACDSMDENELNALYVKVAEHCMTM